MNVVNVFGYIRITILINDSRKHLNSVSTATRLNLLT